MVTTNDDLLAVLQDIKKQLKRLNEKDDLKFKDKPTTETPE
jgi:hypothetical protein